MTTENASKLCQQIEKLTEQVKALKDEIENLNVAGGLKLHVPRAFVEALHVAGNVKHESHRRQHARSSRAAPRVRAGAKGDRPVRR